jgi:CSLREA domain-containing protein
MPAIATRMVKAFVSAALAMALAPGAAAAATITVDVTNDEINADGDCALREAVQAANTNGADTTGCTDGDAGPAVDTIVLLPATQYQRSIAQDGTPNDNQDGDLDVLGTGGPVVIQGDADAPAVLFGGATDRVVDAPTGGVTLTLDGVLVTDGVTSDSVNGDGGGIRSIGGSLVLIDSVVFDNKAELSGGGGISSAATTTLTRTVVSENNAGRSGGGVRSSNGPLTVTDSVIGSNRAGTDMAATGEKGGGIAATGDEVTITNTVFDQNGVGGSSAAGGGLALYQASAGTKTVSRSTFTGNEAGQTGGALFANFNADSVGVTIEDTRIEGNDAGPGPNPSVFGGGIFVVRAELDVLRTVIRDNGANSDTGGAQGGGLYVDDLGAATIDDSAIVANHAVATPAGVAGGGISVDGGLLLRRTTIAMNTLDGAGGGDDGAGLYAGPTGAGVNAYNVTISGNLALDPGSAGGGVHVQNASSFVNLASSTVANNFAGGAADPGDALSESTAGSLISVRNSIVHGPAAAGVCAGTISSGGHNVAVGASCGLAGVGDLQNADPMLQPLGDNGGLAAGPPGDTEVVQTRGLLVGSPAINHVPPADFPNPSCHGQTLAPLATDARAFPRPVGSACEAGAYELTKCFGEVVGDGAIVGTEDDDVLVGTSGPDLLFSLAGDDTVKGRGDADRVCGGPHRDVLKGGKGNDKLNGGKGKDTCKGGAGHDKATACEKKTGLP